ncbi:MAG: hypothetical protein LBM65_03235 [Oscillospiraceae bacterium]|jgi:uncharacterized protein (DUF983 family)|nr:hypothetical protein [Oscillospiraceae bacterium]
MSKQCPQCAGTFYYKDLLSLSFKKEKQCPLCGAEIKTSKAIALPVCIILVLGAGVGFNLATLDYFIKNELGVFPGIIITAVVICGVLLIYPLLIRFKKKDKNKKAKTGRKTKDE